MQYADELEDLLAGALLADFNTQTEDGSPRLVRTGPAAQPVSWQPQPTHAWLKAAPSSPGCQPAELILCLRVSLPKRMLQLEQVLVQPSCLVLPKWLPLCKGILICTPGRWPRSW